MAKPLSIAQYSTQTLMFDADDTLWENNVFFEQAIDRFVELVAHPKLSAAEVRDSFHALEAGRVKLHGYGTEAFAASLRAGFEALRGAPCSPDALRNVDRCADAVRHSDMLLLAGVADTLAALAKKHTLLLVTKGDHAEQTGKLMRSGLASHFTAIEVLREKNADAYRSLLLKHRLSPTTTWMIGNSPRSDINPALAAGMHAVYLPHPSTWVLEQEVVGSPALEQCLLHLSSFQHLLHHFG